MRKNSSWKLGLAAATFVFAGAAGTVAADTFPSKPIKIVHGSSAGAPQDVMLRRLAPLLEEHAGVSVVVEPRPGGSGQAAMAYLKGQSADGYTILSDGTGITSILQLPGAAHKWDDFQPLYQMQLDPFALYVKADGPLTDLTKFQETAEEKPGDVRVGGYGTGSPHQLLLQQYMNEAGITATWVPYSSGTDAITAVMSGEIEAAMSNISVADRFKGRTKVLVVSSDEAIEGHEDVPTFKDEGLNIAKYHWRGTFVHKDTPKEIVNDLFEIFDKAVESDEFKDYLAKSKTLAGTISIEGFEEQLAQQAKDDAQALKELGLTK